ncbi:MAG: carbon starvation CstA family protein, partial [Sutterella wadsworthensis]|nr:carbon starvation CstA family protein [Sutterella wadsworthensis]
MNGLTVMLIALVALACGYFGYARWLEKTWGIDPNRPTPAVENKSGDYAPANKWTVFAHQFTSITGAGPVTGPIIAAMFGWLPALLWMLIGGIFFGAVQDFTALYASVKNGGRSIGMIIEDYIGRTGRRLFLLFCWLFTLLVIA